MGGTDRNFPATEWTQLLDYSQKGAILSELCTKYWKPLYSYLRGSGFGNDKAKDLVQGFLTEKVIEQELIRQADKTRGKLRTFLLTAFKNYVINVCRSEKVLLDFDRTAGDTTFDDPETAYERACADQLLQDVIDQLQVECHKRSKIVHWRLFHEWLLKPCANQRRLQMKDLCEKYGIENTAQAYHMIENIKRRFRSILREHLNMLVDSDREVEAEIHNFINIFQKGMAR
jgi:RNA polymerase sigma-70 factor (ECF subfamily)